MERAAKRSRSALASIGKGAALGGIGLAVAGIGGAVALLKTGVSEASDLNESLSKVNTVFGSSAKVVETYANTAARSMGMTKQATLEAAGTFGNLFSALGIGVAPAADLSKGLVTLATDLGSFNNVSSDDALLALRSGLLGEAEPLRKFGVSLSAARIEAEAYALGLAKPTKDAGKIKAAQNTVEAATKRVGVAQKKYGMESLQARQASDGLNRAQDGLTKSLKGQKVELTAAQKAQAAYSVIMKDTKVAQGDFARTSGGLANQQKILSAQFTDTRTKIGQGLLPVLVRLTNWANDKVLPAFQKLADQFARKEGQGGELREGLQKLGEKARDAAAFIKTAFEKTKTIVDFVIDHKDAFASIAIGVATYAVAMKAAAAATTIMAGINLIGLATGVAGVGTASAVAAPGIAAAGTAAGVAAVPFGLLAAAIGGVAAAYTAFFLAGKKMSDGGGTTEFQPFDPNARGGSNTPSGSGGTMLGNTSLPGQKPKKSPAPIFYGDNGLPGRVDPRFGQVPTPRLNARSSASGSPAGVAPALVNKTTVVIPVYLNGREIGTAAMNDFEDRVARR